MKPEETQHILKHLADLAKSHHLTIVTGTSESIKTLEKEMDGITVFITDGKSKTDMDLGLIFPAKNRVGKKFGNFD